MQCQRRGTTCAVSWKPAPRASLGEDNTLPDPVLTIRAIRCLSSSDARWHDARAQCCTPASAAVIGPLDYREVVCCRPTCPNPNPEPHITLGYFSQHVCGLYSLER